MRRDEGDIHLAVEPVVISQIFLPKSVSLQLEDNEAGARETRERERERERGDNSPKTICPESQKIITSFTFFFPSSVSRTSVTRCLN